jgi:hypothetical protein
MFGANGMLPTDRAGACGDGQGGGRGQLTSAQPRLGRRATSREFRPRLNLPGEITGEAGRSQPSS